jgi:hypothetical protein
MTAKKKKSYYRKENKEHEIRKKTKNMSSGIFIIFKTHLVIFLAIKTVA